MKFTTIISNYYSDSKMIREVNSKSTKIIEIIWKILRNHWQIIVSVFLLNLNPLVIPFCGYFVIPYHQKPTIHLSAVLLTGH